MQPACDATDSTPAARGTVVSLSDSEAEAAAQRNAQLLHDTSVHVGTWVEPVHLCPAWLLPCWIPGCSAHWCWDDDACACVCCPCACGNLCECYCCGCVLCNNDNPFMSGDFWLPPCAFRAGHVTADGRRHGLEFSGFDCEKADAVAAWFEHTTPACHLPKNNFWSKFHPRVRCWLLCCRPHPWIDRPPLAEESSTAHSAGEPASYAPPQVQSMSRDGPGAQPG